MITIHRIDQGTDEWKRLRSGLYTGTSAYKLLRYGTGSYSLTGQSNFSGTFFTRRGHILEDEAIELYEQIRHTKVDRPGFVTNDRFPQCGFSPDGLDNEPVIECKAFNEKRHMRIFNGDIPMEIMAQVHFGMLICERKFANLIIYNPDLDARRALKIIEIKANRNILDNFRRILNKELVVI